MKLRITIILCTGATIAAILYMNSQPRQVELTFGNMPSGELRESSAINAITNNLRQLANGADQYMAEHRVTRVSYDAIVGPGNYISDGIKPIAGEIYPNHFEQDTPIEAVGGKFGTVSIAF
jgi:hypothetical protein